MAAEVLNTTALATLGAAGCALGAYYALSRARRARAIERHIRIPYGRGIVGYALVVDAYTREVFVASLRRLRGNIYYYLPEGERGSTYILVPIKPLGVWRGVGLPWYVAYQFRRVGFSVTPELELVLKVTGLDSIPLDSPQGVEKFISELVSRIYGDQLEPGELKLVEGVAIAVPMLSKSLTSFAQLISEKMTANIAHLGELWHEREELARLQEAARGRAGWGWLWPLVILLIVLVAIFYLAPRA